MKLKLCIIVLFILPILSCAQNKVLLSGNFLEIKIEHWISEDNILGYQMIVYLDSTFKQNDIDEIFLSCTKDHRILFQKTINCPRIHYDEINFFCNNKTNSKYKIDKSFYEKAKSERSVPFTQLVKSIELFDIRYGWKVYNQYSIKLFKAEAKFIKHVTNKRVDGCYKLMISDDGFMYTNANMIEQDSIVYYPVL
jgi:hypothetical protein